MRPGSRFALAGLFAATLMATTPRPPAPTSTDAIGLSEYAGRWVVLNYWATWCAPCIAEMPILSALANARPDVVVIGVTSETITPEALAAFLQKHPVSYRVVAVDKSATPRRFSGTWLGMQARPLTYVIRPNGSLAKRLVGGITKDSLDTVLEKPLT